MALRKRFCRSFNFECRLTATDNGLIVLVASNIVFPLGRSFPLFAAIPIQNVSRSGNAFPLSRPLRWMQGDLRSSAFSRAEKVPPNIQRMSATICSRRVFPQALAFCPENLEGEIVLSNHPRIRKQ